MRSRDDDVNAIHRVVETQQVAFNTNDADPAMIALYVLVHESGPWQIVARQNTLVQR